MKKLLTALVGVLMLSGVGMVQADQNTGDDNLSGQYQTGPTPGKTDILTLKMKPGEATSVSTDTAFGVNARGVIYNTYGIFNALDGFQTVIAASTDAIRAGGIGLSTITVNMGNGTIANGTIAGGTTYITVDITSQPTTVPRNLTVHVTSSTFASAVGVFSTTTVRGRLQVFGIDGNGNPATETILFSTAFPVISTGLAVAGDLGELTQFTTNYGQGKVAWSSISSFTITITSMTQALESTTRTFALVVGYGNRLGLSNDLRYWGDAYRITEVGALKSEQPARNGLLDSDFNTYTPVLSPNGTRSYYLWYRVKNSPRK
jgi:hypothetical protein